MRHKNVNCKFFNFETGQCEHNRVPLRWFVKQTCVHLEQPSDPRLADYCALQEEFAKPQTKSTRKPQ